MNVDGANRSRKSRWECLDVLKAMACLFITNSHCRMIYPWFFLAVGGGQGNGIFFIVSGFLLAAIKLPFGAWLKKRVLRLFPVTALFCMISIIMQWQTVASESVWHTLCWLVNKYWFVAAIFVYYPIYYAIFSVKAKAVPYVALGLHALGYAALYMFVLDKTSFCIEGEGFSLFKVYFYFGVMLTGGVIRRILNDAKLIDHVETKRGLFAAGVVLSLVIWAGEYALITIYGKALEAQALIHLAVWAFGICIFLFAFAFRDRQIKSPGMSRCISAISASTLEIYLLQVTIQPHIEKLPFPVNWASFFAGAFFGGILIHMAVENSISAISCRRKD